MRTRILPIKKKYHIKINTKGQFDPIKYQTYKLLKKTPEQNQKDLYLSICYKKKSFLRTCDLQPIQIHQTTQDISME